MVVNPHGERIFVSWVVVGDCSCWKPIVPVYLRTVLGPIWGDILAAVP